MAKINLVKEQKSVIIPKCTTTKPDRKSTFIDRNRNSIIKTPYDSIVYKLNKLDINELRKK